MTDARLHDEQDELAHILSEWLDDEAPLHLRRYQILADHLLRLGYRKPRTITTAEELDALPDGSIVLDDNGDRELKVDTDQRWLELRTNGAIEDSVNLPATVLYEPKP